MLDASHSRVLHLVVEHAVTTPDKVALVSGSTRITYSQLVSNIGGAAALLCQLGVKPGDHILLSAQKELEFIYLYLAAHLLGIVNVVVDDASPRERLDYIVGIVKPVVVFSSREDQEVDGCRVISYHQLSFNDKEHLAIATPDLTPDDVADVMFTTGTTGSPKGVCLTHANIAGSASNTNGFIGTCSDDIEALALPLSHSFGLGRLRCVLMAGATLILVNNFANLKAFFSIIASEHVTGFGMVPAVWQYIKRISGKRIAQFADQLRYIEFGSASLPVEDKCLLIEMFPNTRLCMHYGLTEASRAMFSEFHESADNLDSIGRPASSLVEASVRDEQGSPLNDGIDGEICVKGNMVSRTYYLSSDNKDAYFGDWFRTGDWGHRDSDGNFYLTGRKKELINVGGEKVSPVTIEEAIVSTGVQECACIAIPDPNGMLGEVPKAFLLKEGTTLTIEEIKQRLAQLLPAHEIPVQWEWVDSLPRTSSGKIQRLKLKR